MFVVATGLYQDVARMASIVLRSEMFASLSLGSSQNGGRLRDGKPKAPSQNKNFVK